MTADTSPGHDPDQADRDARREQERAASRARQRAAYRQAQRDSRSRALHAAAAAAEPAGSAGRQAARPNPCRAPRSVEQSQDRSPTELTAIELVEQGLEEAELQQALLSALAALPPDQRVAVVAALGYAEGSAGAAVELDVAPRDAEQLAQQGLDALRHALSPFLTRND